MAKLTGPEIRELQQTLRPLFNRQEIERLLVGLDRSLDDIARPTDTLPDVIRRVIEAAEDRGWTAALLDAVAAERPDVTHLQNLVAQLRVQLAAPEERPDCPYPGMVPFTAADARFFYGREGEIEQMLQHLRNQRLLFVIGSSGSGKSSLIAAGLLPNLVKSKLFPAGYWLVRTMRPGADPMKTLADALGGDPADPGAAAAALLAAHPPAQRLLLVVDQFEELFSLARPEDKPEEWQAREQFIAAIKALRKCDECALLIAMRADFYPDLMNSALWPVDAGQRLEVIPLRGDALKAAIVEPADQRDVQVEDALVERLLADAAGEPGSLPMLQETLVLLWARMEDHRLTLDTYEKLGEGGRSGLAVAIGNKAEQVLLEPSEKEDPALASLSREERESTVRRIFLRLIQFGEGRPDTRRQQTEGELRSIGDDTAAFAAVLGDLADNRLLTLSGEEKKSSERRVDIAHEALIKGWPRLRAWAEERRVAEQTRRRLEAKAEEWARLNYKGGLLDAAELPEAERWLTSEDATELGFSPDLQKLTEASRADVRAREKARQQQLRRLRLMVAALGLLVLVAGVLAGVAQNRTQLANRQSNLAATRAMEALANADLAATREVDARNNADLAETQRARAEKEADTNLKLAQDLESEKKTVADQKVNAETEATANRLMAIALEVEKSDPTLALRILEKAYRLSNSYSILAGIQDLYQNNQFYSLSFGDAGIISAVFSPNGRTILTAAGKGPAILWDLQGNQLRSYDQAGEMVAFSPDGETILTRSSDSPPRLLRASDGRLLKTFSELDTSWGMAIAFSPAGEHVLTSGTNYDVVLGDLQGQRISTFVGHGKARYIHRGVTSLAFSPDGQLVLTGSDDHSAKLWDLQGNLMHTFEGHKDYVESVAFSPSGKHVLTASIDGTARLWDLEGNLIADVEGPRHYGHLAAFRPDGTAFITLNEDNEVKLWDLGGNLLQILPAQSQAVVSIAFSPDGNTILTVAGGEVRLWPLHGLLTRFRLPWRGCVTELAYSLDGQAIASGNEANCLEASGMSTLIGFRDTAARLWDVHGNQLASVDADIGIGGIELAPDRETLLTCHADGDSRLWGNDGQLRTVFPNAGCPAAFVSQEKVLLHNRVESSFSLWDWRGNRLVDFPAPALDALVSPDGRLILMKDGEQTASLYDAQGKRVARYQPGSEILAMAFSPDGAGPVLAGNSASFWDLEGRRSGEDFSLEQRLRDPVEQLGLGSPATRFVAFSPDGRWLVTASLQDIRVWDRQGNLLRVYPTGSTAYIEFAMLKDGHLLAGKSGMEFEVYALPEPLDKFLESGPIAHFTPFEFAIVGVEADFAEIAQVEDPQQLLRYATAFYDRARSGLQLNLDFLEKARLLADKAYQTGESAEATLLVAEIYDSLEKPYEFIDFAASDDRTELFEIANYLRSKARSAVNDSERRFYLGHLRRVYEKSLSLKMDSFDAIALYDIYDELDIDFDFDRLFATEDPEILRSLSQLFAQRASEQNPSASATDLQNAVYFDEKLLELEATPETKDKASGHYGDLAWFLTLAGRFEEAEKAALRGLALMEQDWIRINLAHVYLLTGRYSHAEVIYLALKDVEFSGTPFGILILADLENLQDRGISHSDMPKIRQLLAAFQR